MMSASLAHRPRNSALHAGDAGKVRIVLMSGRRLTCEAVARQLSKCDKLAYVGSCRTLDRVSASVESRPVDVVLIDASEHTIALVETVRQMRRRAPSAKVVPFGVRDATRVVELVEAGASGYVLDDEPLSELSDTICSVFQNRPPCSVEVAVLASTRLVELLASCAVSGIATEAPSLTGRELEVLQCLSEKLSNKAIAGKLGISAPTAKNHVHRVFKKLGVGSRKSAVEHAYVAGLVRSPFDNS